MFFQNEVSRVRDVLTKTAEIVAPEVAHGAEIWRIARDSGELDLNSSYMYLLFARDFAETSRVAIVDDEVVAFVLAYRRAEAPECLFVWQIAVDEEHRGQGLAKRLLDDLIASSADSDQPIRSIETTVTDDNAASKQLFTSLADRWDARLRTSSLFTEDHFPDNHESERLHTISPIDPSSRD